MTQTDIPTWCFTFQQKLMAALDAAWAILERSDDPARIRAARDRAKAIGDLAAMARKVALLVPAARSKASPPSVLDAAAPTCTPPSRWPTWGRPSERPARSTSSRAGAAGGCDAANSRRHSAP